MTARKRYQSRHLPAFILLALADSPAHGSVIHNMLIERMGLARPDTGAIYRTLQQLEQEGEVVFEWDTSGSGPAKKVYRLTPAGWEKLEEWRREIETRLANLQAFLELYRALQKPAR